VAWRMATEGAVFGGSLVLLSSSPFFFLFESEFCPEVPSFPGFFCGIEARGRCRLLHIPCTVNVKLQTITSPHTLLSTHLTNEQCTTVDSIISFEAKTTVLFKLR
jgi:hypothetical protein